MATSIPKKVQKPMDLLDKVMIILGVIVTITALACWAGYAVPALSLLGVLCVTFYFKAPRRSFPTSEAVTAGVSLDGSAAVVTGPTSGIGTETARVLALRGAHVILAARSASKLAVTKKELEEALAEAGVRGKFSTVQVDLNDLDSVAKGAAAIQEELTTLKLPLKLLVNNAGVMAFPERRETAQGLEAQVGINHVGHFLLTRLLTPQLEEAAPSRVVCVSSMAFRYGLLAEGTYIAHSRLETEPYDPWVAYGNSKLSNLLFAHELNARYSKGGNGISAFSLHPGGIHTGLQGHVTPYLAFKWKVVTPFFFKSISQGAATTLTCATNSEMSIKHGGKYFDNCKPTPVVDGALKKLGENIGAQLWDKTEALVKDFL